MLRLQEKKTGKKMRKREDTKKSTQRFVHVIIFYYRRAFKLRSFSKWACVFVALNEATRAFNGTKRNIIPLPSSFSSHHLFFSFSFSSPLFYFILFFLIFPSLRFLFSFSLSCPYLLAFVPHEIFLILPRLRSGVPPCSIPTNRRENRRRIWCSSVNRAHGYPSKKLASLFDNFMRFHGRE